MKARNRDVTGYDDKIRGGLLMNKPVQTCLIGEISVQIILIKFLFNKPTVIQRKADRAFHIVQLHEVI
jgi:hypothetical protein